MRGLEIGVNDYLMRPVDKNELSARVRTQIRKKRYTDKLRDNVQQSIEAAITDAKKELESNDVARMKAAIEKLSAAGAEIYQEAQKAAQAAGAAGGATEGPQPAPKKQEKKADVVDADFEVVDDDKKKK